MTKKNGSDEPKGKPDTRIIGMPLEVRLTDKELKQASKLLADALQKKGQLEAEVESFKTDVKSKVKAFDEQIARCAYLVNTEKEIRTVECEEQFDWDKSLKQIVRMDTGEVVNTAKVTNEERQQFFRVVETAAS